MTADLVWPRARQHWCDLIDEARSQIQMAADEADAEHLREAHSYLSEANVAIVSAWMRAKRLHAAKRKAEAKKGSLEADSLEDLGR